MGDYTSHNLVIGCTETYAEARIVNQCAVFLQGFLSDEIGISSIEYALLLGFVGAGIVMGADALGTAVEDEFQETAAKFDRRCAQVDSNCDGTKN